MQLSASHVALERALGSIPLGTQTMSKHVSQFVGDVSPLFVERARGSHVWDVDGNEFVDFPMALGPILLGYAEPVVDEAVRTQLETGITFTLSHPLEAEVAERIIALCPGVEAVRFAKSGSDAVSGAIRAARALTGRDVVLAGGYHGWHDWYIGSTTRDLGVPKAVQDLTLAFRYGDLDHLRSMLEQHPGEVAAVVLEPSGAEVPEPGYLQGLVDLAHRHGALAIFDEIIVGFRVAPGGARERYGVEPDLSCYGKALGNGMPISAVAGAWSTMRIFEEVFFSGTHGGEALSLAAARAVLDTIADGTVLADIEAKGTDHRAALQAAVADAGVADRIVVTGEPQRAVVGFTGPQPLVTKSFVQQSMQDAGFLFNGSQFICARHTADELARAADAFAEACSAVAAAGDDLRRQLRGCPVAPVFRAP
jgi:glutamate-1-semialdehyde 2,1-aminomutase/spore coat polysaccharide biosynthesis protein SpsF